MSVHKLPEREHSKLYDSGSYARGCDVTWCGVRVEDMSREDLICFIGTLDYHREQDCKRGIAGNEA